MRKKGLCALILYQFRKWRTTPRMYLLLVMMVIIEDMYLSKIRAFTSLTETNATPFVLPFLCEHPYFVMIFLFGVVMLFGNAPFMERAQMYRMVRSGKTKWAAAQIIYIIVASFLYFAVAFLISNLLIMPDLEWSDQWGKIYNTLAQTTAGNAVDMNFYVSYHIILDYTPWEAVGLIMIVGTLVSTLIGLLLFAGSIWGSKELGLCLASYIPLSVAGINLTSGVLWYFAPATWLNLEMIGWQENGISPTLPQIIPILILCDLILAALVIYRVKKMDIPVLQEV